MEARSCERYASSTLPFGAVSDDVDKADISSITAAGLAVYDAKLWLMSPSCQPYTVLNPLAKGAEDPRAKSFIHMIETVLPGLVAMGKHPTHLLVENVAGFEVPIRSFTRVILHTDALERHRSHGRTSCRP